MFNGKMKAVTFSFDDGVTQDMHLVQMLNEHGLKGTFNLNSGIFSKPDHFNFEGCEVCCYRLTETDVRELYTGHEIAAHTLTHPHLNELSDEKIAYEVEQDRLRLSEIAGYEVVGMAYPFGLGSAHVADVVREKTNIKYARTTACTNGFDMQSDLIVFKPSVYFVRHEQMMALAHEFIDLKPDTPKLFYIWGHAYELDRSPFAKSQFEEFLSLIAGRDDIFYGTNKEVLL